MPDEDFDPETDCCICDQTIDVEWDKDILLFAGKRWHKKCAESGVPE